MTHGSMSDAVMTTRETKVWNTLTRLGYINFQIGSSLQDNRTVVRYYYKKDLIASLVDEEDLTDNFRRAAEDELLERAIFGKKRLKLPTKRKGVGR
jgi:hypothetical protein